MNACTIVFHPQYGLQIVVAASLNPVKLLRFPGMFVQLPSMPEGDDRVFSAVQKEFGAGDSLESCCVGEGVERKDTVTCDHARGAQEAGLDDQTLDRVFFCKIAGGAAAQGTPALVLGAVTTAIWANLWNSNPRLPELRRLNWKANSFK